MTSYRWAPLEEKGPLPEVKEKRSPWPYKLLLQHVGIAVLVSLALVVIFALAGMAPRPLWFVAAALGIGIASLAIRLVLPEVLETSWPGRHDEKLAALRTRTSDNRTQFLATWVQEAGRERRAGEGSQTFVRRVRPLLLELATDRLVHRHGVDPEREPDQARAITGDRLWELITSDDKRTASLSDIEAAIHTIENL
ncbi:hypothetical protein PWY87_13205 [Kribbella solani]|uniref:hypothetical protein n=1 Tax=Kribbella solani TaxID=236067 RepID=UPI0029A448D6|nr:hypothetical protein [Kribbella solani]MDX2968849.1 hypothetical protein [Kribbella solani]MDX3002638.1 hypothetical protein [Kribbella solani]